MLLFKVMALENLKPNMLDYKCVLGYHRNNHVTSSKLVKKGFKF